MNVAWLCLRDGAPVLADLPLAQGLRLTAAALASLVAIHAQGAALTDPPLSRSDIAHHLLAPAGPGVPPLCLDGFAVRRGELRAAISLLAGRDPRWLWSRRNG